VLINCDIGGDLWGDVVKREHKVMYVRVLWLCMRTFRVVCADFSALTY